jgi:hypothetical protein
MSRTASLLVLALVAASPARGNDATAQLNRDAAKAEAHATQAAVAAATAAELALQCGWESDGGFVLQAKTAALRLATQDFKPDSRRFAVMARVLASNAMAGHVAAAKRRVGTGGCADAGERGKWHSLAKLTRTLRAAPVDPPPSRPAAPPPPPRPL